MKAPKDLRQRWLELQYDAIMSNDPNTYVWNTLKNEVANLPLEDVIDYLCDCLECTEEELK
jgi:hypothetical protein